MDVTATPAPKSSVRLQVELPPERLTRAVDEAVRRLSRRTRVPGFRPGKAPRGVLEAMLGPGAVLDEAVEHLVQEAYRKALVEKEILPLANASVEVVQAEEGKPVIFTATVPVRPDVSLGDYRNFKFRPEIETIDDARVDKVVDELRDQHATLAPVEERGARKGDYAVVGFSGTKDGKPIEGAATERMPLILGEERLIPGFESHLEGLKVGAETEFDITFPDDYGEKELAGQRAHFAVRLRELREKVLPDSGDAFAQSMGDFADMATLRAEIRKRLERSALDRARHEFADRIIDYAVANASLELPEVLVEQEVEVMHDELRSSLARQGIPEEAYLRATMEQAGPDESQPEQVGGLIVPGGSTRPADPLAAARARLHADFHPNAEKRVKVLLTLTKIAETEEIAVPDADVEAEVRRARERYAGDKNLIRSFDSERGRGFIRSTLRRTRVVETLVDDWLKAHPEHPALPHAESAEPAVELSPDVDATAPIEPVAASVAPEAASVEENAAMDARAGEQSSDATAPRGRAG